MDLFIGTIVAVIIFLIGIPTAYLIGRRARQVPDLRSGSDFDEVLSPGDWLLGGGLDISFEGGSLTRVSRTYIALWNKRGDTVHGTDVLPDDPLRVVVSRHDEILQVRVVSQSRHQIGVNVIGRDKAALVTFTFLDAGDGFVLEVMHRGEWPALLRGTIPGAKIRESYGLTLDRKARQLARANWFIRAWRGGRGRMGPLLVIGTALSLVASAIALLTPVALKAAPRLVALAKYNLHTLKGQYDFSQEVQTIGMPDPFVSAIGIVMVVSAFAYVLLLILYARRSVPRQIVQNDVDPEPPKRRSEGARLKELIAQLDDNESADG